MSLLRQLLTSPRWRRLRRAGFWLYAALLTVLLLWPGLRLPGVVKRPDLWVHGLTFGALSLSLFLSELTGPARRWRSLLTVFLAASAFGGITEVLQYALVFLNRSGAWDDFAANVFGVLCGLATAALLRAGLGGDFDRSA